MYVILTYSVCKQNSPAPSKKENAGSDKTTILQLTSVQWDGHNFVILAIGDVYCWIKIKISAKTK